MGEYADDYLEEEIEREGFRFMREAEKQEKADRLARNNDAMQETAAALEKLGLRLIRRVFGQVVLPSPFATFRQQTAELLGFEADAPTSDILAALRMRNRRIADLERRWSDAAALADSLLHRLDAVRACLLADDVDGAKLLLSEAAPGAEGTHGAGPGAAEETKEVSRG